MITNSFSWIWTFFLSILRPILGAPEYESIKPDTLAYNRLEINKTVPTPCDKVMWLYTLAKNSHTETDDNTFQRKNCIWPYIVQPIHKTNLILLVINNCTTEIEKNEGYPYTPQPEKVNYSETFPHPCYIATKNNYPRRPYIKCINKHEAEFKLNMNSSYCKHWITDYKISDKEL